MIAKPVKSVKSKAFQEGWVRLGKSPSNYWHFQLVDGIVKCMASRGPISVIQEWREEPAGRSEACPVCRKYVTDRDRERSAYEKAQKKLVTDVPDTEPESLTIDVEPQPVEAKAVQAEVIQHPSVERVPVATGAATFVSFATFVKSNGWDCRYVDEFMQAVMPQTPKFVGGRSRIPQWILDAPTRERITREYQPWRDAKTKESRAKVRVILSPEKRAKLPVPKRLELIEADVSEMRKMLEAIIRDLKVQL